jgi:hypothetical protein
MSVTAPIGSPQQPLREGDLRDLVRAMAKKQAISEHMMIAVRGDRWHLALSLIQRELGVEQPSRIRTLDEFVVKGLYRDVPDGADAGSTLVEDLPMPWGEKADVVLSWADSKRQLRKEVDSIRACLDALGLFDTEEQHWLQELHIEHFFYRAGEVSIKLDRDKHPFSASGNLKNGRILALLEHVVPGLGKRRNGGRRDPWERFLAAITNLQMQSNGNLAASSELVALRKRLSEPDIDAQAIQRMWETDVKPAQAFLSQAMVAVDKEMRRAYGVHPVGKHRELLYDMALQKVRNRNFEGAIRTVKALQHPGPAISRAMGENYYLFAANVIMQAQIGWFERDLERTLKERFGLDLQRDPESPTPPPGNPPAGPSPGCDPQGSSPSGGPSRPRRPQP